MKFSDLTNDQVLQQNVAICLPKYAINHLPIIRISDKAICIELDNSSWVHQSSKNVWLPISQIDIEKTFKKSNFVDSDENEKCIYFQVNLPEWLLRKNNII
jgi:hypothetical protein